MRTALYIVLLLLVVGTSAAVVEPVRPAGDDPVATSAPLEWVRTSEGWQRPASWQPPPARDPSLHPFVVAGLIAMAGIAVLLATPASRQRSDG